MAVTQDFDLTSDFYCYLKGEGSIVPYQTGKWCNEYVAKCSSMNAGSYTLEQCRHLCYKDPNCVEFSLGKDAYVGRCDLYIATGCTFSTIWNFDYFSSTANIHWSWNSYEKPLPIYPDDEYSLRKCPPLTALATPMIEAMPIVYKPDAAD